LQLSQRVCGKIGSLQLGQVDTDTGLSLKFDARRRSRRIFEVRFFGTPIAILLQVIR
jgi:hypothetical protein